MRKVFLAILFLLICGKVYAVDPIKNIWNPLSAKWDYINQISSIPVSALLGGSTLAAQVESLSTGDISSWNLSQSTIASRLNNLDASTLTLTNRANDFNVFRATAQPKIDSWTLSQSTISSKTNSWILSQSTIASRLDNLDLSTGNYINTSSATQTKLGGLNIGGYVQTGSATVTGDFLVRNILIANKRPAITQNAGTGSTSSGEYINGWQFIVSSNDIYVTDLGYYASSLTSGSRPVAIFTAAGVLVSSTDVQSTDSSDGLYKLRAITPVKLSAGNEYAILTAVPVNEARLQGVYTGFGVTNSVNVVSTKTYVSTPYNAPLTLPGSEDVSGVIFPQAGFNFTFSSTLLSVSTAGVGIGTASPAQSFHVHSATFVVTSTGRIGLGTTNPTVTLHLIGSGDQSSNQENRLLWLGSTANYSDLEVQANAGNGPSFGAIANGLTSDPYVSMTQTSNHPMYLGGSTGSNPGIVVSTHTPRRIGIGLDANSINSGSQFQIGAASFTVTTSGNVGIGFSTPTQRLQIVDQTTNGSQINLQSFRGSSGSNSMITLDKYRGTIAAPASVTNGDADGEVRFRAYDGTTLLPTAAILSSVDDIVSTNKMPGNFSVRINSGTTTTIERLKINSLGNVGLGTTDPAARLHVNQTAGAGIAIVGSSDGGANDDTLQFRSSYSGLLNSSDITGSIVGAPSNDGGRLIFRTSQNGTGTLTERMRVTDFGNVGIGTANPPQKLSVTGGTIQSALDGVWFKGRDGSDTIDMFTVERTNNGAEIKTWSGGTSPLLLNPNGNVGIGTMNPSNKFQVIAAGDHAVWGQTNSSSFWGAVFYNSSNSNEVDLAGPHAGIFKVGNVGIGTASPGNKLHVSGSDTIMQKLESSSVLGSYMQFTKTDATDRTWSLGATGSSSSPGDNMFALVDETASSAFRFLVDSSGKVEIGAGAPATELHINKTTPEIGFSDINYDETAYSRIGLASASAAPAYIFYRAQNATHDGVNWVHINDGGFGGRAVRDYLYNGTWGVSVSTWTSHIVGWKEAITVSNDGTIYFPSHGTTASAANAYLDSSNGQLLRSTSSKRYKSNIENLFTRKKEWQDIYKVSGKSFIDNHFNRREIGFIAEEFDEAGLKDLVIYDEKGRPDALKYDRIPVYLLEAIKDQKKQIEDLKNRIKALEEK